MISARIVQDWGRYRTLPVEPAYDLFVSSHSMVTVIRILQPVSGYGATCTPGDDREQDSQTI